MANKLLALMVARYVPPGSRVAFQSKNGAAGRAWRKCRIR